MQRNTVVRSMHDLGLAMWFGGSLMGAVGLNGASGAVSDRRERTRVANVGWSKWTPVNAAGIAMYLAGSIGLLAANKGRVATQKGVAGNTIGKTVLSGAALAVTGCSRMLGAKIEQAGDVPAESGVEPCAETPPDVAGAQKRLRVVQWVIPALTGGLLVLNALHGEQQRPGQVFQGVLRRLLAG
ncbi:hypothetical protein [Streptosporangium pseudovulgare]|uniref:DUF4235 domain-containing protein n=1 Tax=Streptosporangium pseudovulgare TaxID=35765 RepID=A0ABQ2QFM8_9ACTN|nr:hypothetical protein [Streptosporangium pseudovulgare]GGP79937.1 hypothetical protein GCM10010140_05640 [Streptosporangium pseudovulgare]